MSKGNSQLDKYIPMVKFLSKVSGANTEIILYDAVKKEVYYCENSFTEQHDPQSKISGIDLKILESDKSNTEDYVLNYRSITQNLEKVRGSTLFIRDDNGTVIGMMTINIRVNDYLKMREIIEELINGNVSMKHDEEDTLLLECFDYNFEEMMNLTILTEVNKLGIPPERLSTEEKYQIIMELDKKGTFLMKGSIQEVAKALSCSEVTIYRYLQNIKD